MPQGALISFAVGLCDATHIATLRVRQGIS